MKKIVISVLSLVFISSAVFAQNKSFEEYKTEKQAAFNEFLYKKEAEFQARIGNSKSDSISTTKSRKEAQIKKANEMAKPWKEYTLEPGIPATVANGGEKQSCYSFEQKLTSNDLDKYILSFHVDFDDRAKEVYTIVFNEIDSWLSCLESDGFISASSIKRVMPAGYELRFSLDIKEAVVLLGRENAEIINLIKNEIGLEVSGNAASGTPLDIFNENKVYFETGGTEIPLFVFHPCKKELALKVRNIIENISANPDGGSDYLLNKMSGKAFKCDY
ncbi:hypothetical protein Dip518_000801 [Parelusimicrobium proximum]|uniref:hypothetical protein n=1 Tax=Parelusimicrobium proximum TaxID=3228953 RepID=UPI003D181A26